MSLEGWIGEGMSLNWKFSHEIYNLKPKPIVFVGTKSEEKQYTHTHKIKHSTLIKNIDELIMVVMKKKSNFTRKNDDEKIYTCFESTTISIKILWEKIE